MHLACIASPKPNRWTGLMIRKLNRMYHPQLEFRPDPGSPDPQNVRMMIIKDGQLYHPNDINPKHDDPHVRDFGLVIRTPHPQYRDHLLLILAGRSGLGTQAACLAANDPAHIDGIIGSIRRTTPSFNLNDH